MIKADALAIHLNPLQELVQPEGEPKYKGVLTRIKEIVKVLDIPVIVKEVGAGISNEVAKSLENVGVADRECRWTWGYKLGWCRKIAS